MTTPRLAMSVVFVAASFALASCKPASAPQSAQNPPPGDSRHQPGSAELASFVRSHLPPVLRLVDVKNDPPVPMPNTAPGSNVWLYTVRLSFAPVEDELGPPPPQAAQAFRADLDELNALVAWSEAYARSPYASLYPGFTVEPPAPAAPELLRVLHHKDQPFAPLYGKLAAEWQVDHWQFSMVDLAFPADDGGRFRSALTGPILVQGEPATDRFVAATKAAITQAKAKQAAIEAAYRADLLQAARPGSLYRGSITYGSVAVPAEARFVAPPVANDPLLARFEVRLPSAPGYLFVYGAKLASQVPIHPTPVAGGDGTSAAFGNAEAVPKADLTVGLERTEGKETAANTLPNQLLNTLTHFSPPTAMLFSARERRLEGKLAVMSNPFKLSAQAVP